MKRLFSICAALAIAVPAFASTDALSLIPNDAVTVGVVRLADMRSSPLSSMLFHQTDSLSAHGDAAAFLHDAGLQPSQDIDVVMVATRPSSSFSSNSDVIIAVDGRFNPDRLTAALLSRGAVKKSSAAGTYLLLPEGSRENGQRGAAAFPDSHLALAGTESEVIAALNARAAGGTSFLTASGLGREFNRIDPHATAWALIDVARARRFAQAPHVSGKTPSGQALQSALQTVNTVAVWAMDQGTALQLGAFGLSNNQQTLQDLEDTIRGALAAMRLAMQDKSPDLVSVLRKFDVSRTADSVTVSGSVPASTFREYLHKPAASR